MQHWISSKGLYSQLTLLSNCPAHSSAVNAAYICSQVCAASSDSGAIRVLLSEDSADTRFTPSAFNYRVIRPASLSLAYLEEGQTTEEIGYVTSQWLQ